MEKYLVTGGAGFIGSHLVDALVSLGHAVTVVDDLSTGSRANLNPAATFRKMDIRSPKFLDLITETKPDGIFHLAAQASVPVSVREPVRDAQTNLLATLAMMDAAVSAGVKKFIFAATGGALSSEAVKLPTDENHAALPRSPYAIAKYSSELYGAFFRQEKGLDFASFRFANVYGPRQNPHGEAGVVAIFCKRMLAGEPVRINGDGLQTRDYIYVEDVVSALLMGLDSKTGSGPYHVGTGKETDVKTLFTIISELSGYAKKPEKGPADKGAPRRSSLDSGKLKKLGWKPKTKLKDGLALTLGWFKQQ